MDDLKVDILLEQESYDQGFSKKDLEAGLKAYVCKYKKNSLDITKKAFKN